MGPYFHPPIAHHPQQTHSSKFAPLEFVGHGTHGQGNQEFSEVPGNGTASRFVSQSVYPQTLKGTLDESSSVQRKPVGAIGAPFAIPSPGPSVWTSPFGAAVAAFGGSDMKEALATATEAETHMRRGIAAANRFLPSFMDRLKGYFAVSHFSIGSKLLALMFPPLAYKLLWKSSPYTRPSQSTTDVLDDSDNNRSQHNIHHLGPDLYLPLMSYLTYVLLYGLSKATFDDFHPELLSATASFAAAVTILEVIISLTIFYLTGVQLQVIDVLSVAGQKFESLVPILISGIVFGWATFFYYGVFAYFSGCAAFAAFHCLKACLVPHKPTSEWGLQPDPPSGFSYILVIVALCQIPLCWALTPSFSLKGSLTK